MSNGLQTYVKEQIAEISPYKVKSDALLQDAELMEVIDAKSAKEASVIRKQVTAHKKLVGDARKEYTRQLDDVKKQFIAAEKDILAPAEKAQEIIQQKMLDYEAEEAKRQAAEEERIANIVVGFTVDTTRLEASEADVQLGLIDTLYNTLPDEDQTLPQVKLAYNEAKNALLQHIDELTLGTETGSEMADTAAAMSDAADEAEKAAKAAEKSAPKVGIKTVKRFEIINDWEVPRWFCEPSEKLIRAALKDGATEIPGVRIWEERSF